MILTYPACFYKSEDGYTVIFPDLNHLVTSGSTFEEAQKEGAEILAFYISSAQEDKSQIPKPTEFSNIDPIKIAVEDGFIDYSDSFSTMISIDIDEYLEKWKKRSVKRTVTIPYWLEELAKSANVNFSKTLQEALAEKLKVSL